MSMNEKRFIKYDLFYCVDSKKVMTERTVELRDQRNILKILDEKGLFSQIENMTLRESSLLIANGIWFCSRFR